MKNLTGRSPALIMLITICHWPAMQIQAQEQTHSFGSILAIALEKSPRLKEIHQKISLYKAESASQTLANPEISAELRPFSNKTIDAEEEYEVALTQTLKLSDFGARQRVAQIIKQLTKVESKMLLVQFENQLLLTYSKVWLLQEREAYLKKLNKESQTLLKNIISANSAGLIQNSAKLLLIAEQKRLAAEQNGINAEKKEAIADLIRQTGLDLSLVTVKPLDLKELPSNLLASDEIPLVNRIKIRTNLAIEQSYKAKLDSFPEFTPKIGFDRTADGDDRIIAGLTFTLPLFNNNKSERIKAEAEEKTQLAMNAYLQEGLLQNEIDLLLSSAKNSQTQATLLAQEVLPSLEEAYQSAQEELKAGQGSALQLWQILKEKDELHQRYLELWIQSLANRGELAILTGLTF
jgi:hypothetical protein